MSNYRLIFSEGSDFARKRLPEVVGRAIVYRGNNCANFIGPGFRKLRAARLFNRQPILAPACVRANYRNYPIKIGETFSSFSGDNPRSTDPFVDYRDSVFLRLRRLHRFSALALADPSDASGTPDRSAVSFSLLPLLHLILTTPFTLPFLSADGSYAQVDMIFQLPLSYIELQRHADSVHKKFPLSPCLPFISALGLPRTVHLPPSVVEIYFNLLAVKACQLLRCSLISKPTPVSATLLANASPPSHSLRDEFSAFSYERTALSLYFSSRTKILPRGSLALSRFRVR